jgi:hypothetical protein
MSYNALSGTVKLSGELLAVEQISASFIRGDGENVTNIPRIVANASTDNLLTVGANANSMVGEPNLTFNGSVLTVNGAITASSGVSASIFYGDGSQLTGITGGGGGGANAQGPDYSIQFTTGSGGLSGSAALLYTGGALTLTGAMNMSGTLTLAGALMPAEADVHDLGSSAKPWRDLYISGSSIHFGSEVLSVSDNNLKFGSGSATKGFDVGFMNFKNNGIFMDEGRIFQLRAYQMRFYGGIGYVRKVVAADYTIKDVDYLIGIQSDTLTGSITLTLPSAAGLLNGQTYIVKDEGGAVSSYPVTVMCDGGDSIDGQNQVVLQSPYAAIQIYCNGSNKYFIC